jgi:hypothetical protein
MMKMLVGVHVGCVVISVGSGVSRLEISVTLLSL